MDIDVNKIKDAAAGAADALSKNEDAKKAVDGAIEAVEKKVVELQEDGRIKRRSEKVRP